MPMRTTDEGGIKAALVAYCEALEGCERVDLHNAVNDILTGRGGPRKWSPSAPELAQLVRDQKARRVNHNPEHVEALPPPDPVVSDKVRAKRAAKVPTLLGPMSHEQWVQENIKWGTIKPYVAP